MFYVVSQLQLVLVVRASPRDGMVRTKREWILPPKPLKENYNYTLQTSIARVSHCFLHDLHTNPHTQLTGLSWITDALLNLYMWFILSACCTCLVLFQIRSDHQSGSNVHYSLEGIGANKKPLHVFVVDPLTGTVRVTKKLDREEIDMYIVSSSTTLSGKVEVHFCYDSGV